MTMKSAKTRFSLSLSKNKSNHFFSRLTHSLKTIYKYNSGFLTLLPEVFPAWIE